MLTLNGAPQLLNMDLSVLNTALQLHRQVDGLDWVGVTEGIAGASLIGSEVVVTVVEDGVVATVEAVTVEATSLDD